MNFVLSGVSAEKQTRRTDEVNTCKVHARYSRKQGDARSTDWGRDRISWNDQTDSTTKPRISTLSERKKSTYVEARDARGKTGEPVIDACLAYRGHDNGTDSSIAPRLGERNARDTYFFGCCKRVGVPEARTTTSAGFSAALGTVLELLAKSRNGERNKDFVLRWVWKAFRSEAFPGRVPSHAHNSTALQWKKVRL